MGRVVDGTGAVFAGGGGFKNGTLILLENKVDGKGSRAGALLQYIQWASANNSKHTFSSCEKEKNILKSL